MKPYRAAHYADRALHRSAKVCENVAVARDTLRLRFDCPEIARHILPGQFLMLRLAGYDDPLLGRPLALYDTAVSDCGEPWAIDVVYLVKGKLTRRLADFQPGQKLEIWGPLGNGFIPVGTEHLIMVAGGIGQTPFVALAQESLGRRSYGDPPREAPTCPRVTLCYGAQTAELLAGIDDFESVGVDVRIATDDGTRGHLGPVTDILEQVLKADTDDTHIVCCGPEPMMEAVTEISIRRELPCRVSLETPMACGIGICFSCVARVRDANGVWDYRRTCVDGPVFDARDIVW